MVAVFLTVNDELPNTELEKIGEVLPRIEVQLIYLKGGCSYCLHMFR